LFLASLSAYSCLLDGQPDLINSDGFEFIFEILKGMIFAKFFNFPSSSAFQHNLAGH